MPPIAAAVPISTMRIIAADHEPNLRAAGDIARPVGNAAIVPAAMPATTTSFARHGGGGGSEHRAGGSQSQNYCLTHGDLSLLYRPGRAKTASPDRSLTRELGFPSDRAGRETNRTVPSCSQSAQAPAGFERRFIAPYPCRRAGRGLRVAALHCCCVPRKPAPPAERPGAWVERPLPAEEAVGVGVGVGVEVEPKPVRQAAKSSAAVPLRLAAARAAIWG